LSLPLDLFFQQIIAYPSTNIIDVGSNATIARTINYDPDRERRWGGGPPTEDGTGGDFETPEDTQMDAFIYPYWQRSGVDTGIPFTCPTGNCTYDPFETVAADFQCRAMPSDFLEFGCKNTSAEWLSTVTYAGPGANPNITSCGYYMNIPGQVPQLMSGYEVEADGAIGEVLATRFFALTDVLTNELFFDGSIHFKDIDHPVTDFVLASTPGGFDGAKRNETPVVQECEIHWVVKTVKAEVRGGQLFEESTAVHQFPSSTELTWDPEDSNVYAAEFALTLPDPHSVTGETSTYQVSNTTGRKVNQVWVQIAPSTYTLPSERNPAKTGRVLKYWWLTATPRLALINEPDLPWDTPHNATDHLAQAVKVMNQVIRRNTLSASHRHDVAVGLAYKTVVLVDIRWQWITLPVALLLFSLVFLATTMWRSSKDREAIGIWKTSALAILVNGLGDDVQSFVGPGSKKQGYVRRKAKDIKVQLDDD
jgi:hypothetical protein